MSAAALGNVLGAGSMGGMRAGQCRNPHASGRGEGGRPPLASERERAGERSGQVVGAHKRRGLGWTAIFVAIP